VEDNFLVPTRTGWTGCAWKWSNLAEMLRYADIQFRSCGGAVMKDMTRLIRIYLEYIKDYQQSLLELLAS
jgi:hypothetical protein